MAMSIEDIENDFSDDCMTIEDINDFIADCNNRVVMSIEEIEKEVRRLYGSNDVSMPIVLEPPNESNSVIMPTKRKIVVKKKK